MALKLHCPLGNFRGNQVFVTAALCGLQLEHVHVEYSDSKSKEFLQRNPLGKVPVLETPEGHVFETNSIVRHLARTSQKLYGQNLYQQALVDQYLDLSQNELVPSILALLLPVFGHVQFDKEVYKTAKTEAQAVLKILEDRLKTSKYLTGNDLTIADVQIAVLLSYAFRTVLDQNYRQTIKHVVTWYESIASLPQFVKYLGKVRYTVAEWEAQVAEKKENKKKEQVQAAQQQPQKQQQQQQQQQQPQKQQQQKKEEKKSPKKQPTEQPKKQEEEKEAVEQKQSGFDLYSFKTLYTNAKDKNEAVKFLLDNWKEGQMSLYKAHYDKYQGEGEVLYQFNNLKGAFIQRCEAARKVAFGTYSVYGEEPNLEILGVWLFTNAQISEEMRENPSFEYTKWDKLDVTNAAHIKVLTDYWVNTEDDVSVVDGRRLRSFSTFK